MTEGVELVERLREAADFVDWLDVDPPRALINPPRVMREAATALSSAQERIAELEGALVVRHVDEWHEDFGPALWWYPDEPPYCGSPLDNDWPGYHEYWTALPAPNDILRVVAREIIARRARTTEKMDG